MVGAQSKPTSGAGRGGSLGLTLQLCQRDFSPNSVTLPLPDCWEQWDH